MKNSVQSKSLLASAILLVFPFVSLATGTGKTLSDIMSSISGYLDSVLLLMMGFAVVMFVWYVVKYFIRESESEKKEAATYLMWSLVGFFVILSMWGIVNIMVNTFNLGSNSPSSWSGIDTLFPKTN